IRVVGWPFSATVASAIAFISLNPSSTAEGNQIPNSLIGSGSRSMRRKPLVKYSSRKAIRSKGKFTTGKISRPGVGLKAEIALPGTTRKWVERSSCRRQDNVCRGERFCHSERKRQSGSDRGISNFILE